MKHVLFSAACLATAPLTAQVAPPDAPTEGWKHEHDDSYCLNAIKKQRKK